MKKTFFTIIMILQIIACCIPYILGYIVALCYSAFIAGLKSWDESNEYIDTYMNE